MLDKNSNFLLTWEHPFFPNGVIIGFFITLNNFTSEIKIKSRKVSPVYNYTVLNNKIKTFNDSFLHISVIAYNIAGNSSSVEYYKSAITPTHSGGSILNIVWAVFPVLMFFILCSIIWYIPRSKMRINQTEVTTSTSGFTHLSPREWQDINEIKKIISSQKV